MKKLRILHTADLHLDSPFEALPAAKAAVRRSEQRELFSRITKAAVSEEVDLVLLSGDLFDSDTSYYETGETLAAGLRALKVPVVIAPGNHDFYFSGSPYAKLKFPENVHIFTEESISCFEFPALSCRVYGAAFTDKRCRPLLEGFRAEENDGIINLMCIHGEVGVPTSIYNPISEKQLAHSGISYCALGHVHKASGLLKSGSCFYSQPGCPEGRGFDETGDKYVNIIDIDENGGCELRQLSLCSRQYRILSVDITGQDPLLAIHSALPDETMRDIYRIVLTGECETAPKVSRLMRNLEELFFSLQIRDNTRPGGNIWQRMDEDTLRGLFLSKMREKYDSASPAEKPAVEKAVRWGLAALDGMEELVQYEN